MRCLTIILSLALLTGCATQRGFQTPIPNYDRVDMDVLRGAQPNSLGIAKLKGDGVKSVLNLRKGDAWPAEEALCTNSGIRYLNLPLAGVCPSQDDLEIAVAGLQVLPKPCFVHCQWGCERTGLVIACWRVLHGMSVEDAWKEAKIYGCSSVAGMKEALVKFARKRGKV